MILREMFQMGFLAFDFENAEDALVPARDACRDVVGLGRQRDQIRSFCHIPNANDRLCPRAIVPAEIAILLRIDRFEDHL